MVQMKSALGGIPVSRAMITNFATLSSQDTLEDAVEMILRGSQEDFPVMENGRVVGVLMRSDLFSALKRQGNRAPVGEVMRRDFHTADSHEMLEVAFRNMQECQCHTLPVTHGGQLVGVLTMDNVGEFLAIQAALEPGKSFARRTNALRD